MTVAANRMPLEVSRCGRFFRRPFDDEPLPEEKDKAQCCKWAWQQAVCLAKVCLEGTGNVGGSKTLFDPTVYTGTAGKGGCCSSCCDYSPDLWVEIYMYMCVRVCVPT